MALELQQLRQLLALAQHGSFVRAAKALHLSQPALSASLARLRTHFNDPILARTGNSYELTPLASRLSEHTAAALLATAIVLLTVRAAGSRAPHNSARVPAAQQPRATPARISALGASFAANPQRHDVGLELVEALLAAGRGADAMAAVARLRQLPGSLGKGPRVDLVEAEAALAVSEYQRAAAAV